jgi:hypothetical protein
VFGRLIKGARLALYCVTYDLLMEKYLQQRKASVFRKLGSVKRRRSPDREEIHTQPKWNRGNFWRGQGDARYLRHAISEGVKRS